MKPLLYFSYGMTKTGSTLAYHLVCSALTHAGQKFGRPPEHLLQENRRVNFVHHLDEDMINEFWEFAQKVNAVVVLKTHTRPDPAVVKAINDGRAIAHACYRDPRDMALSMLDHGVQARRENRPAFSEIHTMEDAKIGIRNQCDSLSAWLQLPNVLPLCYEDIAFDMDNTISKIQAQIGVSSPTSKIRRYVENGPFTQLNKGIPHRHRREISTNESALFLNEFEPFYTRLLDDNINQFHYGPPLLPPRCNLYVTNST